MSYNQIYNGLLKKDKLALEMHSDVLVIGGGVIGLSIAREIQKRGIKRITLLDKGCCGGEASWAAAGMLTPQAEADERNALFDLCCASRDLYPAFASELSAETGIDIELDRTGTLYLAFSEDDIFSINKRLDWQRKAGLSIELLSAVQLRKVEPSISQKAMECLLFPDDWQVENRKLVAALRSYAEKNGIKIRQNTSVEKLIAGNNGVVGAETAKERFTAEITIVATGAWTSLIKIGDAEMPFEVEPVRGQIVTFKPSEQMLKHVVCSAAGYLVPRRNGRILAGSTLEKVGFDKSFTDSAAASLSKMAVDIVPALGRFDLVDQWAGLRPFAVDGSPVLGTVDGLDGLYIATAHYRNGILLAPLTAKLIADKLVNDKDSKYLTQFRAGRFYCSSSGSRSS